MKKKVQPPQDTERFEDMGLILGLRRGSKEPNPTHETKLQGLARLRKEKEEQ